MSTIIGRKQEIEELNNLYYSDRPEFVAVYGRRRVGKTFLIKQALKDRITFQHTGVSPVDQEDDKNRLKTQLDSFYFSLLDHGLEGFKPPMSWMEAFFQLEQLLKMLDNGGRQVVFIDELPWLDTPKSQFISALESFWNGWCSSRDNMMLIVCGSATSWMIANLPNNKGGLYGRLTDEIKLLPFTLSESEEYLHSQNVELSRYDIVQSYMVFGGIPYYLSYFKKGLSLEQNIDTILFGRNPRLKDEFNRLFAAVFTNADQCKKIIRFLATKHKGFTREEISQGTGLVMGGGLSKTLKSLCESEFVLRYVPYGEARNQEHYKLIDNFCLFWLKYVEQNASDTSFMSENAASDILRNWKGVAFEEVCWQHIDQIRKSLVISGIKSSVYSWSVKGDGVSSGAQIDLVIDRADNVLNLCEMKFSGGEYIISSDEELRIRKRIETLKKTLPAKKTIHMTMVTTYGIAYGKHSGIVQKSITMDDLFC